MSQQKPGYLTWTDNESFEKAMAQAQDYNVRPINRTQTKGALNTFKNIDPNTSVRDSFNRRDYEYFRPEESIPKDMKGIISTCLDAYYKIGVIHNTIDLMADFASQGINLVSPIPKEQDFYRKWFQKVKGQDRSERFQNLLYRLGNVAVKRVTAQLKIRDVDNLQKGFASTDIEITPPIKVAKREIPWEYIFLNPLSMESLGNELSKFVHKQYYALKIPNKLADIINNPKTDIDRDLIANLPEDIRLAAKGSKVVYLDPEKVSVYFYKKDDWQEWAYPMTYCILDDLIMLEKMKLADLSALDGATSHIRLWRLGDLKERIIPNQAAMDRLTDILASNVGGGCMDLVWGPELSFEETGTDIHKFLGAEKYGPTMNAIYGGLGIPQSLSGDSTKGGGFTNNFLSLKTLIERLNYGRSVLVEFWEREIKLVQRAMGFKFPAEVIFDRMTLSDESAEKALLIQMADRDLISVETIQERFGELPELERLRMDRENKLRDKGKLPNKAGPWHNPQIENDLKKIALQSGIVTPSEVGLELDENEKGQIAQVDKQIKVQKQANLEKQNTGIPQQGRPTNSKDSKKRKQKQVKPRKSVKASTMIWAKEAQKKISDIVNPMVLKLYNKANMRQLTAEAAASCEDIKTCILYMLEPFSKVDEKLIATMVQKPLPKSQSVVELYNKFCFDFIENFDRQPNLEEERDLNLLVYLASIEGEDDG